MKGIFVVIIDGQTLQKKPVSIPTREIISTLRQEQADDKLREENTKNTERC